MENLFSFLGSHLQWVWLAIAILCLIIEGLTLSLTTLWFGISAFIMIFISLAPIPFPVQLLIFFIISLVLLFSTRPFVKKKLSLKRIKTNYETVLGKTAIVIKDISQFDKGKIKINGMEWTAAVNDAVTLKKDDKCVIEKIEGVTAYVKPLV